MSRLDPHSYADLEQGRIAAMSLDLFVNFAARRLEGTAVARLAEPAAGPLDLDTRDLDIRQVRDAAGKDLPWRLAPADKVLGSKLTVDLPPGTREFSLDFRTSPEASALQWLEPAQTDGGDAPVPVQPVPGDPRAQRAALPGFAAGALHLQGEDDGARGVDRGDGRGAGRAAAAGSRAGTRSFTFEMPQSIPPYLFAFAVGDIVSRDLGPRSRVYTEPKTLERAAWEFAERGQHAAGGRGRVRPLPVGSLRLPGDAARASPTAAWRTRA